MDWAAGRRSHTFSQSASARRSQSKASESPRGDVCDAWPARPGNTSAAPAAASAPAAESSSASDRRSRSGRSTEIAIAVVDAWQGRGVGNALMASLVNRSRREGLRRYKAEVLADNLPMLRLLEGLGETRSSRDGAAVHVTVELPAYDV